MIICNTLSFPYSPYNEPELVWVLISQAFEQRQLHCACHTELAVVVEVVRVKLEVMVVKLEVVWVEVVFAGILVLSTE
jgi:hypothetical protein